MREASMPEKIEQDLVAIRRAVPQPLGAVPEVAIAYLSSNYGAIEWILKIAYRRHTIEERRALAADHRELNKISADEEAGFKFAMQTLSMARSFGVASWPTMKDDHVHQVLRAIKYAKYLVTENDCGPLRLLLHPIADFLPKRGA